MLNPILIPQDQVFWYLEKISPIQLKQNIKVDVVIVGGGIAGLTAAQSFFEKGYSVALLEKYYCGAGSSGKSSGFITPDSELDLTYFKEKFGSAEAKKLWEFVTSGVKFIENNINKFNIDCDYQVQDTIVIANSEKAFAEIKAEHKTRTEMAYQSTIYDKTNLEKVLGSDKYFGAVRYPNTFGIKAFDYCQGIKNILQEQGIKIFEETPVIKIHSKGVDTPYAKVEADQIIVCTDKDIPQLQNKLNSDVYHAQTFLMISSPLSNEEIKKVFPQENLMAWDTDLIYQYFRVTGDNRFMIGGSDLVSIFWPSERHNYTRIYEKLTNYVRTKFPEVKMNFENLWPGLIGVSKDIMPLAGTLKNQPNIYYIGCAAGLPWAAALGNYSAERLVNNKKDLDNYFSLDRKFPVDGFTQTLLGKKISFALSNLITLYK